MYKLLLFIHKTDNEEIISHFNDYTGKYLSELSGSEIKLGDVESSLLLDVKYSKFCEITVDSKNTWDEMMNSKTGKLLNKDLMDFHQFITLIFVDFGK